MDPNIRSDAKSHLSTVFAGLGQHLLGQGGGEIPGLSGVAGQLEEFAEMPVELATIFLNMSTQLAELVLTSLEQAGFALVKGLTPA